MEEAKRWAPSSPRTDPRGERIARAWKSGKPRDVSAMSLGELRREIRRLERVRRELEVGRQAIEDELTLAHAAYALELRALEVRAGVESDPAAVLRSGKGGTKTEQILRALPGTKAEIACKTGIKPTTVSTLLARLQRDDGPIEKIGTTAMPGVPNRKVAIYGLRPHRRGGGVH